MYNDSNSKTGIRQKYSCPKCTYKIPETAKECPLCHTPRDVKVKTCPHCKFKMIEEAEECPSCLRNVVQANETSTKSNKSKHRTANKSPTNRFTGTKAKNSRSNLSKKVTSRKSQAELIFKNQAEGWLNFVRKKSTLNSSQVKELKKPANLIGLFFIGLFLGLSLWASFLVFRNVASNQVEEQLQEKTPSLSGVFSYGGDSVFASLSRAGMNTAMEKKYPEINLRYTKPLNGDLSSSKAIEMLIKGNLSFAFNARSLTIKEIENAKARGVTLKSVPIAMDGVVIYSNIKTPKTQLTRKQIRDIYTGKKTNWSEIDPECGDFPIVPITVKGESLEFVGLANKSELGDEVKVADNHTLAVRQTIKTPGAIAFASSSLVQDQQLVKMYKIADGSQYIMPSASSYLDASYALTRRIFLVSREDGTRDQKGAEAYIDFVGSEKGREKVKQSGLVPIL